MLHKRFSQWAIMIFALSVCMSVNILIVYAQESKNMITFENQSGKLALVKLVGPTAKSAEVPHGETRTVNVTAGDYYILTRYGNTPDQYTYTKGEPFTVTETATQYSVMTITLHTVVGGDYPTHPISQEEFDKTASQPSPSEDTFYDLTPFFLNAKKGGIVLLKVYSFIEDDTGRTMALIQGDLSLTPDKFVATETESRVQVSDGKRTVVLKLDQNGTITVESDTKPKTADTPATQTTTTGQVKGMIVEVKTNQPVEKSISLFKVDGIEGERIYFSGEPVVEVRSDLSGTFVFQNVPPGNYVIFAKGMEINLFTANGSKFQLDMKGTMRLLSAMSGSFIEGEKAKTVEVTPGQTIDIGTILVTTSD